MKYEILNNTEGIFIDVGCHIGYYSMLSSILNKNTYSIDYNDKFLDIFKKNIKKNNLKNISIIQKRINADININFNEKISLIKIDIEGDESCLLNIFKNQLKNKMIEYLIIEISPKINNTYNIMIEKLYNFGYIYIYDIGLSPQRKLNFCTNHLNNLINKLDIEKIDEYLKNMNYGQSNFLFKYR